MSSHFLTSHAHFLTTHAHVVPTCVSKKNFVDGIVKAHFVFSADVARTEARHDINQHVRGERNLENRWSTHL